MDLGGRWVLTLGVGTRESLQLSVLVFTVPSGLGLLPFLDLRFRVLGFSRSGIRILGISVRVLGFRLSE